MALLITWLDVLPNVLESLTPDQRKALEFSISGDPPRDVCKIGFDSFKHYRDLLQQAQAAAKAFLRDQYNLTKETDLDLPHRHHTVEHSMGQKGLSDAGMKERCERYRAQNPPEAPRQIHREAKRVKAVKPPRTWTVQHPDGQQEVVTNFREFCAAHSLGADSFRNSGKSHGYRLLSTPYSRNGDRWQITHPDGRIEVINNLKEFGRQVGLHPTTVRRRYKPQKVTAAKTTTTT